MWSNKENLDDNLDLTQNLVHPTWENVDPTPNIQSLFSKFNFKFFQGKLVSVELEWSKRMYQCAGICYSRNSRYGKACVIRLSEPLLKLRTRKELIETLLHEMIHAYLFILNIREANGGHGPNFLKIAAGINRQAGTNITVYHTFHDEVDFYKKHWWRCNGLCQKRAPYFGYVKRVSNRAPSSNDLWWGEHLRSCGGVFQKIKEPEPTEKGRRNSSKKQLQTQTNQITNYIPKSPVSRGAVFNRGSGTLVLQKPVATEVPSTSEGSSLTNGDIRRFLSPTGSNILTPAFIGTGIPLGGGSTNGQKRSRLLDEFPEPEAKKNKNQNHSIWTEIRDERPDEEITIIIDDSDSKFLTTLRSDIDDTFSQGSSGSDENEPTCPVCSSKMPKNTLDDHLTTCLSSIFGDDLVEVVQTSSSPAVVATGDVDDSCILIEPKIDIINVDDDNDSPTVQNVPIRAAEVPIYVDTTKFPCPNCPKLFSEADINDHLDICLS